MKTYENMLGSTSWKTILISERPDILDSSMNSLDFKDRVWDLIDRAVQGQEVKPIMADIRNSFLILRKAASTIRRAKAGITSITFVALISISSTMPPL